MFTPTGPVREVFPIHPPPPVNTGYPGVVLGPEILINVPDQPGTGIIDDGPGSYVPPFPPGGPVYDADSGVSQGGPADDGIKPDASGKVHTPQGVNLPGHVPDHWTRQDLEDLRDDLEDSIAERQAEQQLRGEDPNHRRRIDDELRLLRQIEKKLGGS